ncbi:MAG: ROK family transcriptional regulator [Ignavibacteriales bacterium]|nr:MAG: ROK family transcriptional regulator [Ignavibacteriales bacterium]
MKKVSRKNKIRRNLILRELVENGQLSLSELKDRTGITLPVVSDLVTKLKKEGLILEVKDKEITSAGRPPVIVKLNGKAGYVLGIDFGRIYTNFILVDLELNIVAEVRKKSIPLSNDISIIDKLESEINKILEHSKVKWKNMLGIGLSIPGIVSGEKGISKTYLNFGDVPLRETLRNRFKLPVHIEHDVKAMTLGELWFGEAKKAKCALCLNLGWGLSLGVVIDGRLYYGSEGFAGEFGHIQIKTDGPLCYCGKHGCLETLASGKAITQIAREKIANGASTIITANGDKELNDIDSTSVLEAASQGDQFSIELIEEAGKYLGQGIGILINILNPDKIILGGGIANAARYLIDSITSTALKQSLVHLNKNVKFVPSELGWKAGALGVAMLAARDLFEVEHLNPTAYV